MRLKHLPEEVKYVRRSFNIEEGYADKIKAYGSFVKHKTGQQFTEANIIASMIKTFLEGDRGFAAWYAEQEKIREENANKENLNATENLKEEVHSSSFNGGQQH